MAEATLCAAFQHTAKQRPDAVAVRSYDGSECLTWSEYADRVRALARGLYATGVRPGDTVALMLANCVDFHIVDAAVLHSGAVPFSIYNTFPADTIAFLLSNAEPRLVVCQSEFVPVLKAAAEVAGRPDIDICVIGGDGGTLTIDEVIGAAAPEFDFDATWSAVRPDDVATIIYTSGTTGQPKGVEITHNAIVTDLDSLQSVAEFSADDTVVSYLPDAHIANRVIAHYTNMVYGVQVATVANPKKLFDALVKVAAE